MKCLVIRHLAFEDLGLFAPVLARHGIQVNYRQAGVDVLVEEEWLQSDLVVVLGGPISVYETEDYPWLSTEVQALRTRLARRQPTLGICLGAQLMAAALGARVYPGTGKEIGWAPLTLIEKLGQPHLGEHILGSLHDVHMLHWHGDTFDLPVGADVLHLASTSLTPHQAFSIGQHALALQFHPEVDSRSIESWLIGHACELQHAGISRSKIREDSLRYGARAAQAGEKMLTQWLQGAGLIQAPANTLQLPKECPYQPVNCEFHDVLESCATLRKRVAIELRLADGNLQHRQAIITDVFGKNGVEYLMLDTGETFRLDALVVVDGVHFQSFNV